MAFRQSLVYGVLHVALRVSIHCCRPVAVRGRHPRCARTKEAEAGLARLRFPAGLSTTAEQQPAALCPEKRIRAGGAPQQAPVVHRPRAALLRLGRRMALCRPAGHLRRPLQWRHLRSVLDTDADRTDLELRLIGYRAASPSGLRTENDNLTAE